MPKDYQRVKLRNPDIRRSRANHAGEPKDGLPLDWREKVACGQDRPQDLPGAGKGFDELCE